MEARRWFNPGHPQTLQIAVFLLYANAFFALLNVMRFGLYIEFAVRLFAGPAAAYGIANDRKWGYGTGVAVAVSPFVIGLVLYGNPFSKDIIGILFDVALVALLVHPMSREYQKIWFK